MSVRCTLYSMDSSSAQTYISAYPFPCAAQQDYFCFSAAQSQNSYSGGTIYSLTVVASAVALDVSERLQLEVGRVRRDREDAEGVGVAEAALPPLHGNDGRSPLDDIERETALETKPDAVVDLSEA